MMRWTGGASFSGTTDNSEGHLTFPFTRRYLGSFQVASLMQCNIPHELEKRNGERGREEGWEERTLTRTH